MLVYANYDFDCNLKVKISQLINTMFSRDCNFLYELTRMTVGLQYCYYKAKVSQNPNH
jgi:hypothetical protein